MSRPTQVQDIMTKDPLVVSPEDTARTAHAAMKDGGFRHLPVVSKGLLVGIISMSDIGAAGPASVMDRPVSELMSPEPMEIAPEVPIEAAAAMMGLHKVGCLPVVAEERLVGIITTYDLLDALASRLGPTQR